MLASSHRLSRLICQKARANAALRSLANGGARAGEWRNSKRARNNGSLDRNRIKQDKSRRERSPRGAGRGVGGGDHGGVFLRNGERGAEVHTVSEAERIRLTRIVMEFREQEHEKLEFPASLTNTERKFIHSLCDQVGLRSRSTGKGAKRRIVVRKMNDKGMANTQHDFMIPELDIGKEGVDVLKGHVMQHPPTPIEHIESRETGASLAEAISRKDDAAVASRLEHFLEIDKEAPTSEHHERTFDLFRRIKEHAAAQKAKQSHPEYERMLKIRSKLPAFHHEDEIVKAVSENNVTIISGDTGCGKSTQVPQFLLDSYPDSSIVVTQPRRISAISLAERVAQEQCEEGGVGNRIGYQVRLDSAKSKNTQLLFLTPGILLRQMRTSPQLNQYSVIVIDEIHERDQFQEFLLIVLRDLIRIRPDLRIVLMSATLQTTALVDYFKDFTNPALIKMQGRMFPVQEFFLEDVLQMTGYIDPGTFYDGGILLRNELEKRAKRTKVAREAEAAEEAERKKEKEKKEEENAVKCTLCGKTGFADTIALGAHMVMCAPSGLLRFFNLNASRPEPVSASTDSVPVASLAKMTKTNKDEAKDHPEIVPKSTPHNSKDSEVVEWGGVSYSFGPKTENIPVELPKELRDPRLQEQFLSQYQERHDDEEVDNALLIEIIKYIVGYSSYGEGGLLVFLPGWQEISELKVLLESTKPFHNQSKFLILPFHSGIPSREQRRVLQRPPDGVRKIVLATNIAETSLTIDDISFVIDSGRAKQKNYDPHMKTSTLNSSWISQASAKQRKGRAGRTKPGVCFHLFSRRRHSSMLPFTESELLRTPLEEICLMCKQLRLAPGGFEDDDGVPAFLSKAMTAPHSKSIQNAVELLVDLGAFMPDTNNLTNLGVCLATISLHPRVGKMVIWSYLLGCARVASNMAVGMSYKTPFTLPPESMLQDARMAKLQLSEQSESDQVSIHLLLEDQQKLDRRAFNDFCNENFISTSTMQMISDMKQNLTRELNSLGFLNPAAPEYYNRHDDDHALWQAAIAAGLYPNVASRRRNEAHFKTMTRQKVTMHISSVNSVRGQPLNRKCVVPENSVELMAFGEMIKGEFKCTATQTTHLASPLPLLLLCGTSLSVHPKAEEKKTAILNLDGWITFECDADTAAHIVILRRRLESAFWNFISDPSAGLSNLTDIERDAVEILGTIIQSAHQMAPERRSTKFDGE